MTARSRELETPVALLRQYDPLASTTVATPEVEDALAEIAQAIMRQPRQPRQPRSRIFAPRLRIAVVVAAVAVLAGGVATAAVVIHAHTGLFASGHDVSVGGPGEELNPAAADFKASALKLSADIPYPVGYEPWRDWVLTVNFPKSDNSGGGTFPAGLVTTGALRGWFAASAFCAWVQDWRQATVSGDSAAAAQAAQTIAAAPSWEAVTAEDPHPNPASANDPGAEPGTLFGWMLPYRAAVSSADRGRVEQLLASGYGDGRCWLSDPAWMTQLRDHPDWSKGSPQDLASHYEQFLARERS
jgi:hypothetical protein